MRRRSELLKSLENANRREAANLRERARDPKAPDGTPFNPSFENVQVELPRADETLEFEIRPDRRTRKAA